MIKKQKTPHILIEGCDKTGKTTLANFLSERLGMPIKKFNAPVINPFQEYAHFVATEEVPHIIDRMHVSELVYGPVKRGRAYFDSDEKYLIESALAQNGVMAIYAQDDEGVIADRFVQDNEQYLKRPEIALVLSGFSREIGDSLLSWKGYQPGKYDMEIIAAQYESLYKLEESK